MAAKYLLRALLVMFLYQENPIHCRPTQSSSLLEYNRQQIVCQHNGRLDGITNTEVAGAISCQNNNKATQLGETSGEFIIHGGNSAL